MKYACLIYGDGNLEDPLADTEMDALIAETLAYHEESKDYTLRRTRQQNRG
jgi:hypothetical protein